MPKRALRQDTDTQNELTSSPRGIILVNDFTETTAKQFMEEMQAIENEDPNKPILILIDSFGGEADSLTSMLTIMDSHTSSPIHTVALGKAMSCGAVLLSHGDVRWASKHTRILIHETSLEGGSDGAVGIHDIKNNAEEEARFNKYLNKITAENVGMSLSEFEALFTNTRREIFLDAKGALKFGIVDKIGFPKLEAKITYRIRG